MTALLGWLRFLRHFWDCHRLAVQSTENWVVVTCDTCLDRWTWGR